ncbi:redoxin domain-containing protein [Candidatus Sumerlaeota bacterium]|nr:redoxin domain-containing protein [Candidatus Sumerlaeota bacterium]
MNRGKGRSDTPFPPVLSWDDGSKTESQEGNAMSMKSLSRCLCIVGAMAVALGSIAIAQPDAIAEPGGAVAKPRPTFDLAQHKGRVVVLEIGSAECKETEEGMRALEEFRQTLPEGIDIAYVEEGKSTFDLDGAVERAKPGYGVFCDPDRSVTRHFDYQSNPTFYLIGKWGDVRYRGRWNAEEFDERSRALLSETSPKKENYFLEKRVRKGRMAPDFNLPTTTDQTVSLKETAGKSSMVLIVFGQPSCPHSQKVFARFNALGRLHKDEGLSILPVHVGEYGDEEKAYYDSLALDWPVGIDGNGKLADLYEVDAVPMAVLVERNGRVFKTGLYDPEFEDDMRTYLRLGPSDTAAWNIGAMMGGSGTSGATSTKPQTRNDAQRVQQAPRKRRAGASSSTYTPTYAPKPPRRTPTKSKG